MTPAVIAIVRDGDGRVLLVGRKEEPGRFGMPGGKMELGETRAETVIRETLEETGIVLDPGGLREVLLTQSARTGRLVWVFVASQWHGEAAQREPNSPVRWGTFEEAMDILRQRIIQPVDTELEAVILDA